MTPQAGAAERGFSIRAARPQDLDALERIENAVFDSDRLSRRALRRFLQVPTTDVPVAEAPAGVVGYAMIGFRARSHLGRLFSLAVAADHAGRGVGRALLQACEAAGRRRGAAVVRLEVRTDNHAAIALYEGSGYEVTGREDDFYEDGAAALTLEKRL